MRTPSREVHERTESHSGRCPRRNLHEIMRRRYHQRCQSPLKSPLGYGIAPRADRLEQPAPPISAIRVDYRQEARLPMELAARIREMFADSVADVMIGAQTVNVSRSGVCMRTLLPLPVSAIVQCELLLPNLPVSLPTLMQVRWTRRSSGTCECGLRYLV